MKKLIIVSIAAALAGCAVTKAEWGGEDVVRDADGNPLIIDGKLQRVTMPTKLYSNRHWFDSHIDAAHLGVKGGEIVFDLNGYGGIVSSNIVAFTHVLITDAATLATKIGAAIATAGGTAAADGVSGLVSRFLAAGGNTSAAKVECKDGRCTISDGCVSCSSEGCTACLDSE